MPVFPSVEWFDAIKTIVNSDAAFRHNGTIDTVVGVKVGAQIFEITFEAFECEKVREAARTICAIWTSGWSRTTTPGRT